jgi:hypothetical protein
MLRGGGRLMSWEAFAAIFTGVAGVAAALAVWYDWRKTRASELRLSDVYTWSRDAVRIFHSLRVIAMCNWQDPITERMDNRLSELALELSIVIEQGRLLFKNESNGYRSHRPAPFRGFRPRILDPLVAGYVLAIRWKGAPREDRQAISLAIEKQYGEFLHLAQEEVGRKLAFSRNAAAGGDSFDVEELIAEARRCPPQRFNFWC